MSIIAVGDVVGFVYAQPGNDVTYLLVRGLLPNGQLQGFDVSFGIDVTIEAARAWPASERELNSAVGFGTGFARAPGSYTIRQLAEEARARD